MIFVVLGVKQIIKKYMIQILVCFLVSDLEPGWPTIERISAIVFCVSSWRVRGSFCDHLRNHFSVILNVVSDVLEHFGNFKINLSIGELTF